MIKTVVANTPYAAWKECLKIIKAHGVLSDEKRILDGIIVSEIEYPTDEVQKNPIYQAGFIGEYKKSFLSPDNAGFEYRYGERLCSYPTSTLPNINQVGYIVAELRRNSISRRAVAITWCPAIDAHEGVEDVPCLQLVKCRMSNNRLHMETVFRSHDMLLGYYPNVLGLSYLQKHIANELGRPVGKLTVVSMSPHVYLSDKDQFKGLMGVRL